MRAIAATPALLMAALLVAGCAAGAPGADISADSTPAPDISAGPSTGIGSTASATGATGAFSATDTAWLQLTAAMAQRLLPVLDLVPTHTTDPAWRRLAAQMRTGSSANLERSRRLLAGAGAPTTNPHEGHDMPGMITADGLAALRSANGTAFHRLLAAHLRAHLAQSVRVAAAEQQGGVHPGTAAMATAVVRSGNADLARLDQLDRPPAPGRRPA
ncbi:DUF305 domain-containing protein [Micromonospora sp. NPDC005298]|uniref:DUF305 domain-containing protein n=1 Tax=Micromonospora sp. NPDC005298 TaxID=3156873 RepID=UPI0033B1504E